MARGLRLRLNPESLRRWTRRLLTKTDWMLTLGTSVVLLLEADFGANSEVQLEGRMRNLSRRTHASDVRDALVVNAKAAR